MFLLIALLLQGEDWPSFRGPRGDASSIERGLLPDGPRELWRRPLGIGYGAPATSGTRLVVADREGDACRIACLEAATGKELWTFRYPTPYVDRYGSNGGPRASPVIDDGRVYLHGVEGLLHCLKLEDGSLLWKDDVAARFGVVPNFFGAGATPLVEGDLLLVVAGGSPPDSPDVASGEVKPAGSALAAYDKKTGALRWAAGDDLAAYGSPVVVPMHGRRRGFLLARGGLLAFDPAGGKIESRIPWRAPAVLSVNAMTPVVSGDLVFVSEGYSIGGLCLRMKPDGHEIAWQDGRKRERSLSSWWSTPVLQDGILYGPDGMDSGPLRAVELASGKVLWTEPALRHVSLLRVDGKAFGLEESGILHLLDLTPAGVRSLWKRPLVEAPARSAPILSRGRLYVRGASDLVALQAVDEGPLPPAERAAMLRDWDAAIARSTEALAANPRSLEALSKRGDARFFKGLFKEAVEDFDAMVRLDPSMDTQHWRRGIARYYAGDFAGAAAQFESYHSFDQVDRENGIWRYLSQFKAHGKERARLGLLKYAKDDREPFPAVYQLFAGETTADEILKGIAVADVKDEDRQARNFYARLYIGLNAAVEGRDDQALVNLREAVAIRWPRRAGYGPAWMWQVGRIEYERHSGTK